MAVNSGETVNSGDKWKEIVWCDHVSLKADYLMGMVPTCLIDSPRVTMVVEDGKIKLVCPACLVEALKQRQRELNPS